MNKITTEKVCWGIETGILILIIIYMLLLQQYNIRLQKIWNQPVGLIQRSYQVMNVPDYSNYLFIGGICIVSLIGATWLLGHEMQQINSDHEIFFILLMGSNIALIFAVAILLCNPILIALIVVIFTMVVAAKFHS